MHTHCSACGRKLREKRIHYGFTSYADWLNHRRDCPLYGMAPDMTPAQREEE